MKKVKFNVTTAIKFAWDEQYTKFMQQLEDLRYKDYEKYTNLLKVGIPGEQVNVAIGDEVMIPDWYYEAHKDDVATINASLSDIYIDKATGLPTSFHLEEALHHHPKEFAEQKGLITEVQEQGLKVGKGTYNPTIIPYTMKKVHIFELCEEEPQAPVKQNDWANVKKIK